MCRFLATASRWPVSGRVALDDATARRLAGLATRHRDGWGVAWLDESTDEPVVRTHRSSDSFAQSWADGTVRQVLRRAKSRYHLVHLREASPGLGRSLDTVHPLEAPGHALVHNGFCDPVSALWSIVDEVGGGRLARHTARTDSAYLLQLALLFRAKGAERPLWEAASLAKRRFPSASLNSALLSSRGLEIVSMQPSIVGSASTPAEPYYALDRQDLPNGRVRIGSRGVLGSEVTQLDDAIAIDL